MPKKKQQFNVRLDAGLIQTIRDEAWRCRIREGELVDMLLSLGWGEYARRQRERERAAEDATVQ